MMSLVPSQISSRRASRATSGRATRGRSRRRRASGRRRTRPPGGLGGGQLGLGGLGPERLAGVGKPGRVAHQQARLVEGQLRVDEPERDRLELVDRLAERLALPRVGHGVLERGASDPERVGRELHPRPLEAAHQPARTPGPPRRAGGRRARSSPRAGARPPGSSGCPSSAGAGRGRSPRRLLEHERGDAARAGARGDGGEDRADLGHRGVADVALAPVEDVAAVDLAGLGDDRCGVRAGAGLGDRERSGRRVAGRTAAAASAGAAPRCRAPAAARRRTRPGRAPARSGCRRRSAPRSPGRRRRGSRSRRRRTPRAGRSR